MVYIIKYLYRLLENVYEKHKDPRVQHLPLVGSPWPIFFIIVAYLAIVLHYGPKWMENRKPYNLKNVMRVYNAVQVVANLILFYFGVQNSYLRREFSLTCQPVDHTNTEPWMWKLIYVTYGYYITKYLDLLDTIFFVLRKKNNQITFLHVYHHAGMVFGVYVFMTFMAGSHSTMLGAINLFIHTVMYSYYFVTSVRPIKETLWWKRHITELQLLQFGYLMLHFLMPIVRNTCQHPMAVALVGLIQNLFMFALFFDFYHRAYLRKSQKVEVKVESEHLNGGNTKTTLKEHAEHSEQQMRHNQTTTHILPNEKQCRSSLNVNANSNSKSNNNNINSIISSKSPQKVKCS